MQIGHVAKRLADEMIRPSGDHKFVLVIALDTMAIGERIPLFCQLRKLFYQD